MNRRRFLSLLAGAGAASATSYFFAPVGGWRSDVIAHAQAPYDPWPPYLYGIPYFHNASTSGAYLGINRNAFYVEEVSLAVSDLRKMYPNRMEQGNMLNRAMSTLQRYWDGERKRLVAS